jgi:TetR/AcrR family transcriptional repressor of mexJK operon
LSIGVSSPRLRPSSEAKRAAIVEAAADAFFRDGYEAVSIEAIAEAAGVSKVTIYSHFGDKRNLFAAAVEAECGKLRDAVGFDQLQTGSIRDRLVYIGRTFSAFIRRPQIVQFERRVAAETEHLPEIGTSFLDAGPRRIHGILARIIEQACENGEIEVSDAMLAAEQFVSMCKGFGDLERRFEARTDPDREEARVQGAVEVFLRAYGVR